MAQNETDKQYQAFKIPKYIQEQQSQGCDGIDTPLPKIKPDISLDNGAFYEIEYDTCSIKGVGKFVLKPQKIDPPQKDEIKEMFYKMREINRNHHINYNHNLIFDRQVRLENSIIFYQQGIFMKDFTDDYTQNAEFSSYFPNYQMMKYEQLRTYFTWRTNLRNGKLTDISLSYAFIYIYELINNIGVENPQAGLNSLMNFWKSFREYNKAIDKYVIRWLKDYHIYYNLPFNEFIAQNNLIEYYPQITNANDQFNLFCSISKYDIKKSSFYTKENEALIEDCFNFVIDKLKTVFTKMDIDFNNSIFAPTKKMSIWQPFNEALFYSHKPIKNRRIVFSQNEIYICKDNVWEWNTTITCESGRQLISYVIKQMEVELRTLTGYKAKLSANITRLTHPIIDKLDRSNLSLKNIITGAVLQFYKDLTKIVVSVDHNTLAQIREEALITQEKLVVEEEIVPIIKANSDVENKNASLFNEIEINALRVILSGENIKSFADKNNIMLEVLIDNINEKAIELIGDNILDEDFIIYDDYLERVEEITL